MNGEQHDQLRRIGRDLLVAIGEDPDRDGLVNTPDRFARWWAEFIDHDGGTMDTAFEVEGVDEMIVLSGLETWSLCEHHLLPFSVIATIGYVPEGKVLGVSKLARILHHAAHRLQVQERLAMDVADAIEKRTGSSKVGVILRGEHLCMTMRGVRTKGAMTTTVLRGAFKDDARARAEFLSYA